jgi:predicted metal-dependent hydrolase
MVFLEAHQLLRQMSRVYAHSRFLCQQSGELVRLSQASRERAARAFASEAVEIPENLPHRSLGVLVKAWRRRQRRDVPEDGP